jgi:hypothetical protein
MRDENGKPGARDWRFLLPNETQKTEERMLVRGMQYTPLKPLRRHLRGPQSRAYIILPLLLFFYRHLYRKRDMDSSRVTDDEPVLIIFLTEDTNTN